MKHQRLRNELTELEDRARALRNSFNGRAQDGDQELAELADIITQALVTIRQEMVG